MNQGNQNVSKLNQCMIEANEKLRTAKSILIVLETDLSAEHSDSIHLDVVKVVHNLINEAQQIIVGLQ